MKPAIFLDRDGVIIENRPDYVRSWRDVEIYPQALEGLARIKYLPHQIIIVTNQSAVGRSLITLEVAQEINRQLVDVIRQHGGRVDNVYMCHHAPTDDCACRKPQPGLLHQAATALTLDLGRSLMIGDALTDLMAGQAAGVKHLILLRTGRGVAQEQLVEAQTLSPFVVYNTLKEALVDYFHLT